MNIVGINQVPGMYAWQHDSAATIIKDGVLISSAEEERFNRLRHSRNYPHHAIAYGLTKAGITLNDVDVVAISYNPYAFLKRWPMNLHWKSVAQNFLNLAVFWKYKSDIKKQIGARVLYVDHHLAHASSAYRASGFTEANIVTIDGSGETESVAVFVAKEGTIKKLWDIPFSSNMFDDKKNSSIGLIYTRVTNLLGLGVNAEGKTMGLASYGKPVYDFSSILHIKNHRNFCINRRNIEKLYGHMKRDAHEPIEQKHKDFAASLQKALEDSIVNVAYEVYKKTGIKNFCLAGGVALNCNTNTTLLEHDFVENIFIQPAANDAGASLGAALEVAHMCGESADFKMIHAYWGPSFENDDIEHILKESKLTYEYVEDIEAKTARYIYEGNLVGWFQGAMEMGPRALGNRSILANPTIKDIDKKINQHVKHREVWRPFAPSVSEQDAHTYFEIVKNKESSSPYMLHVFFVKEKYRDALPAITHVDGSSRIQTVTEKSNRRYLTLIKEFEKLSGYPIILNTSFNDKGEPIVCTPRDAIRCFFATGLDVLVLGNYVVKKQM